MTDEPPNGKESVLDILAGFAFDEGHQTVLRDAHTITPARRSIRKVKAESGSPKKRPRSATKRRMSNKEALQRHRGFPPSIGDSPRVLILGSAPCEMSLEKGQFYGNPRNHFWAVMAYAMDDPTFPMLDFEARCSVLHSRGIALWNICDVFTRYKSSDATLHCEEYTDIAGLLVEHPTIGYILCNGSASYDCMLKYDLAARLEVSTGLQPTPLSLATQARGAAQAVDLPVILKLPSTSPANAMADPVGTKGKVWKEKLQEALSGSQCR
ncbi:conserved hypothetical protein [Perkinsus marinus ATCC 50983]|uniref:Uracil-DNA glycosylase-like domain-containing protein n=1 Tax=Perkinsus marinus (strain ATCC 50983 / TXsc) TaxID=423536 RepID=C5K9X8_PERM5|nr:conserved hypothetical protein [Perkinsus marinus ATCC 50983]EER18707.1 conserved hypothetical protein [Perkinsus marinus ATCC 50983]|eukprot:XP_002786911.1 conserved hypothetical protein [Perkinsus marinus ATCC 50983]